MKIIKSATLESLDAICVDVEATFTKGLPSFSIVGLASSAIQESKDRVKSALLTNDFKFPPKKITINLSPSDINKNGTHFDLSIALLVALYDTKVKFDDFYVFAELALDGTLKDNSSIFPLILSLAKKIGKLSVLVPKSIEDKIAMIPNIDVYSVKNLNEAIMFFNSKEKDKYKVAQYKMPCDTILVDGKQFYYNKKYELDFKDVKGQKVAKRAALIAASGNHNIIFEGSPGCGKSMIIKRLQYIMPPQTVEQILEKAKLDSLNLIEPNFDGRTVFRSPHHTSTRASIFGGGTINSKIGEIALSNNGILFFDELPHFPKAILESMREPLEDNKILISRVNSKTNYETKFLFACAMNPCPCGNLLSSTKECRCNDLEITRYKAKLSDPFCDRIDLFVTMNEVNYEDKADISSKEMYKMVLNAFRVQIKRGQSDLNGKLKDEDISKYCLLDSTCENILNLATTNYSLSFRSINKVLKVARTIADLEASENIKKEHIFEALSFRKR
ncbi:Sigma 54 interacting domain protein [Arcobacter nitrofigilis DSM 7299]|uniref:Sigma 54 interacting domain protein n=1 Tax=Arcobacter nitrofigilis (strain ATCC 33309 / DSM 7299 / CCUG 15893 / LMG 7604 / NCTC 12251 / CI) TaxID=572480 RepID=D5V1A6_ARCNC|nr:YifB family Mg chelatase-like AAA ATPase [Arcobacter nitrofigilis]ADG94068.1 Sigma 54 interacting domain protein [Arcobacter nitrofigilis DSM 7299]